MNCWSSFWKKKKKEKKRENKKIKKIKKGERFCKHPTRWAFMSWTVLLVRVEGTWSYFEFRDFLLHPLVPNKVLNWVPNVFPFCAQFVFLGFIVYIFFFSKCSLWLIIPSVPRCTSQVFINFIPYTTTLPMFLYVFSPLVLPLSPLYVFLKLSSIL